MSFKDKVEHLFLKYAAVPRTPSFKQGKRHIACIGDSITYGAGVNGKREETWEYFLNGMLGEEHQVLNYGISARTLQDEGDYPYKADKFYRISKEMPCETYLIMLGTNDAKPYNWDAERYEEELISFVREYKELSQKPRIVLMSPPQVFEEESTGIVAFEIDKSNIEDAAKIVWEVALKEKVKLIDLYTHTKNHPEWFVDGVHPNKLGNRMFAEYIYKQLNIFDSIL